MTRVAGPPSRPLPGCIWFAFRKEVPRYNGCDNMLRWLLLFVPVTVGLEFLAPESHTLIFAASCLAILPLAGWLGDATEQLAHHTGEGIGGLLNATFGNAAELIIAIMAMREGLYSVVKASLTGSIIGNILLVLGAAAVAGGTRYKTQRFNATAARSQATLMTLASIALIVPAGYHYLAGTRGAGARGRAEHRDRGGAAGDLCGASAVLAPHPQASFQGGSGRASRTKNALDPEAVDAGPGGLHCADRLDVRDPGGLGAGRPRIRSA